MATASSSTMKVINAHHAISTLQEQTRRFSAMSVQLAKSGDHATSQANQITQHISELVDTLRSIQQNAQSDAADCRKQAQDQITLNNSKANERKRQVLETGDLGNTQTLKANFRLIFGPTKETPYPSRSTQYVKTLSAHRIQTIRELCESYPHGVIAFLLAQPIKVWREARREFFDGIIKTVKEESEQNWPEEIIDIMSELDKERPMCKEFGTLRGMIAPPYSLRSSVN